MNMNIKYIFVVKYAIKWSEWFESVKKLSYKIIQRTDQQTIYIQTATEARCVWV